MGRPQEDVTLAITYLQLHNNAPALDDTTVANQPRLGAKLLPFELAHLIVMPAPTGHKATEGRRNEHGYNNSSHITYQLLNPPALALN